MRIFKRYIALLGFVCQIAMAVNQNPVTVDMASVSNLPDVEFYDILEDNENYIWLAADKGLYRYNGQTYKRFVNNSQKANSLFQLKLDEQGKLWCNNIYGQLFYVENDCLKLFYDANILAKGQLAPYQILRNSIRLFTVTGVYDINKSTKKVTKVFDGICLSSASTGLSNYTFLINNEGLIKQHRLYKFENNKPIKILEIKSSNFIQTPKLFAFKDAVFFIHKNANTNVIYLVDTFKNHAKQIVTPIALQNEIIYNLLNIDENYWFLTSSGAFLYTLKHNKLEFKEQLFKAESITDVEVDFNGNYWFTTLDNGVVVSPNLNIRCTNIEAVDAKVTAAVALENNNFVLGTNNGKLLFYNESNHIKSLILPGKKVIGKLYYDTDEDQLIVSINSSESYIVSLKTNKIIDVKHTFAVAKSFSKIGKEKLFYGNYRQGIVYNNPFNNPQKQIIKESRVKASVVLNNQLYVSYVDGFYKYNLNTFHSEEISYQKNSLLVNSITKYNRTIWLATQHNGLLKLENNNISEAKINLPNQLQVNEIQSDGDILWISTDLGLFHYNTISKILKLLGEQDGLNTAVNNFLVLRDKIIITSPKAFYILPKQEGLFKEYNTTDVRIESVSINDIDTLVKSHYKLPYNLNNIGLKFNSNGFQSNANVKYQYRVKQIDTSWHDIPLNTHFVNFNSLASNTYTFELKAQNVSAKQPVFARPITFIIAKPFWETYWFYGLVLSIIFGLIWLYFSWRLQQKEEQRIAEIDKILIDKKITNLRLENLRSQMNPHFIFNALNSIQDYIVSNEKELASSYLVKFSRLIRMYLDYSQQNEITLEEELNALKLYLELEKVRFEDELEYKININHQIKTKQIKVPSLFIQPYVENALKHGLLHKSNDRQLTVDAKIVKNNILQITIEDNGIGRAQSEKLKRPNQQHKPFATKANEERVHLYKNKLKRNITIGIEDLYNQNQIASGTMVVITMPIQ
ncbi:sensor histidine kinase [Winogradskyella eckloniae]|uniref:sensor histidine kinase n=1 Tax=Winogradskyella eckloniae TaxID=1089306 RepID=UPI001F504E09|nr:histidine kinase [Winogradskyella eckloniae]